jgi:hypothetical protein
MKMTDDQMLAQLELVERQAVGYYTGEVAHEQALALDYYHSKPFGTEEPGRSAVVSSDVWDVVEGLTPAILRPFLSSDDVVKFNPLGPDDEESAKQESEYINWVVTQRNDSFPQLVAWCKTGLLQKNGVVKYWWEKNTRASVERYYGKELELVMLMLQEPGVKLEAINEAEPGPDGVPLFDVELRTTEETGSAKFCVIPPEEFLISRDAQTPNPKAARFVQHRRMATIAELRGMGYKVDDDIPDGFDFDPQFSQQYQARRSEEERNSQDEGNDPSMREVLFKETFWLIDRNGDGEPELRKLCTVGKEILADEETEEAPFAGWTPYPQPFKFYGGCPADESIEIQKIKSTLWRQSLDNIYTINNNRVYANESVTLDDLIDNQIAGVVRVKGMGNVSQSVMAAEITPIAGVVQPMMEYLDSAKENRTGFSRYNQGSADLGNQKTLGEVQLVTEQSGQRTELVTRSFANGLADLMRGIHGLCRRHATKAETIKLRGKWVQIDPRGWKERLDLSISVGLGASDQRMKLQGLQMIMNEQKAQIQLTGGKSVSPENLYNAAAKMAEATGFKQPEMFFTMPQQEQGLPPQVQQILAQAQQEIQQLQQENAALKSGVEVKKIEVESRERIESAKMQNALAIEDKRDDQKRDAEELKSWLQLVLQKMQPNVDLSGAVAEDIAEEPGEPVEEKPDPMMLLAQALQGMNAPKRKRMSIQAPSGQVYQGMIEDDAPEAAQ